ncbi:MAG: hypothetical protein JWR21_965 [Herminiimonas sp.]|nr:hypothetical protein [Herminiimonas sp.]
MTINRSANGARTNIPDYTPSRPVNATPAKGTGWAGYGASSRQRAEKVGAHVDQSVGDKWRNQVRRPPIANSGRATATTPPESRRPPVDAKLAEKPAREVFRRVADSGQVGGTSKTTKAPAEPSKPASSARTRSEDVSLPLIDTTEEEEVLAPTFTNKKLDSQSASPKIEILKAVQKLVDAKHGDKKSPVYVQGLVYERRENPGRVALSGIVIVKKSESERLAKQYRNDPVKLQAALDVLGNDKTKTLKFSDETGWKNTRLSAAVRKQGGTLKAFFKDMIDASASVQESHAPSLARQTMQIMLKGDYLEKEGVFRTESRGKTLDEAQCKLVNAGNLEAILTQGVEPSNLLKRILREMPEKIISGSNKTEFLALDDVVDAGKKSAYQQAVANLPPENRDLLGTLMRFLDTVAGKAEINKMGATNLGMVFSMVIAEEEDLNKIMKFQSTFQPVVAYMIEHAHELFPDPNATTPSPKKAAHSQVKDNAGPGTVANVKSTNIDGSDSSDSTRSTNSSESTRSSSGRSATTKSTTPLTTPKASPARPPVEKGPKRDVPPSIGASPLETQKASSVNKTTYPNKFLKNAQSAMDAANFIMTHAAKELGEDWRWEP